MSISPEEIDFLATEGTRFLASLGLGDAFRFDRLPGGRNNRVYRAIGAGNTVALKWYFQHPLDPRDRLNAECSFYEYARACGVAVIARKLGVNRTLQLAAYALLPGRSMSPHEVAGQHIDAAIAFIRQLNPRRRPDQAEKLSHASEACFSLRQHLDCVSERVSRLSDIGWETEIHRAAAELVATSIEPALAQSRGELERWARSAGVDPTAPLAAQCRCVSPSDFGFHNALLADDGRLGFFDFEYAGWDDPAKLLCDFFCQPAVPAPIDFWPQFLDLTASLAGDTKVERQRQALLFPLYQVKWCCILLNEFHSTDRQRREFAERTPQDLSSQLDRVRRAIAGWRSG